MLNYNNLTEEALFKLMVDKDPAVLKYIYDKYSPGIYGVILQKTKFRKYTDEILVKTFISFFQAKSYKSFSPNSIFINLYKLASICIKEGNVFYMDHSSADLRYLKVSSKT